MGLILPLRDGGMVGCGSIGMGTPGSCVLKLILRDGDLVGCG